MSNPDQPEQLFARTMVAMFIQTISLTCFHPANKPKTNCFFWILGACDEKFARASDWKLGLSLWRFWMVVSTLPPAKGELNSSSHILPDGTPWKIWKILRIGTWNTKLSTVIEPPWLSHKIQGSRPRLLLRSFFLSLSLSFFFSWRILKGFKIKTEHASFLLGMFLPAPHARISGEPKRSAQTITKKKQHRSIASLFPQNKKNHSWGGGGVTKTVNHKSTV